MYSRQPTSLVISRHYCFKSFHSKMNCIKKFSRIVCVSLFSYQGCSLSVLYDSLFILSYVQMFVNNFFKFLFQRNLKRRRRDLNPRAAINDLLPFQGSPFGQLGYFSKLSYLLSSSLCCCLLSYESLFSITDVS